MTTGGNRGSAWCRWWGVAMALALVLQPALGAVTAADSWASNNPAPYHRSGNLQVLSTGVAFTVTFPASGFPEAGFLTAFAQSSVATFAGDYKRAGIHTLSMGLTTTGGPSTWVVLIGASDRYWAATATTNLSMDRLLGGWSLLNASGDLEALWNEDLRDVKHLGVRVVKFQSNVTTPQTVTVSNFSLTGSQVVGAIMTLEDALEDAFGEGIRNVADVDPEDAAADTDGDGMNDLDEILAEYQPGYFSENLFKAQLTNSGSSVTIHFACVSGKTYSVRRADAVDGTYEQVGVVNALSTGYGYFTDNSVTSGPNFYRVVQQ